MWIRSQDKKQLINVTKVYISSLTMGKKGKISVLGDGVIPTSGCVLGKYSTMDEALLEIDEIEKAIINNPDKVYHMRAEL